ncbi:hypothetical protein ASPWEDRAFT_463412 [Aspergillus wentii DTO 134E9]|uniref:Uncharacterized protein n=1 Tax=Aspergillus wentii DTO 134E9 TaxID=1073089 RepID=A0A1L9RRR0_ASPWE|nr:uncharacterized protein ASPWEDRAFT_463412 [Aspergillus wentii DTO 134E9]KAI9930483.1 hypothetical protein MW887_011237 [Aspergillus wentii]OJJ37640.1 hypothetical protein ASPWEDRAFT_463412 [Aspergillus wentii DTO 134E9]
MADENPPGAAAEVSEKTESVGKSISPAGPSPSPSNDPQRRLLAALKATDNTVHRLDKLVSSAAGEERALAITGYLSHALHHLLASAPSIALQTRLSLLARLRQQNRKPTSPQPSAPSSSKLLALSSLISETRYTLRLFGLLPLWTWGSQTIKNPPSDPVIRAITLIQVVVNVIYQALENGGYLAAKGIVSKKFVDRWGGIDKWYLWSTRAWFGHIFFQFFALWRQSVLRRRKTEEQVKITGKELSSEEERATLRAEIRAWRKSLVNNVFWAPLCLHWSVEKGIGVPDSLSGVISFCAGAWGFYDLWNATV